MNTIIYTALTSVVLTLLAVFGTYMYIREGVYLTVTLALNLHTQGVKSPRQLFLFTLLFWPAFKWYDKSETAQRFTWWLIESVVTPLVNARIAGHVDTRNDIANIIKTLAHKHYGDSDGDV